MFMRGLHSTFDGLRHDYRTTTELGLMSATMQSSNPWLAIVDIFVKQSR